MDGGDDHNDDDYDDDVIRWAVGRSTSEASAPANAADCSAANR